MLILKYRSFVKKGPCMGRAPYKSAKEVLFRVFPHLTRQSAHALDPNNWKNNNVQQNHQKVRSRILMGHNTLNSTMSPWAWCTSRCTPSIHIAHEAVLLNLLVKLAQGWMLIWVNFDPNWAKSRGWLLFCEWTFFCKATVANNYYLVLSPPELIIMSDSEKIPPVPIENRIKNEIPFLSNVMVVGDQRNFLACLMTLKVNFHIANIHL